MSILEDYNVSFVIRKIHRSEFKLIISTKVPALSEIFYEIRDLDRSYDFLQTLNDVIANKLKGIYYTTQSLAFIDIQSDVTSIYSGEDFDKVFKDTIPAGKLPTEDLKEIVLAWIDFIRQNTSFKDYILKEYQVTFNIQNNNGIMMARFNSKNKFLDQLIEKLKSVETIDQLLELIKFIERYNHAEKAFSIPGSKQIVVLGQTVKILSNTVHLDGALTPDYTLPLSDFKEFVLEWKVFLSKNRLNEI
ncbi:hypothetical protein [Chryseobacterium sp.]|uniref:hypothetical protein n=1 Tax=Chryseobacterium sp. TaxID=1871047 RepID=UPI00321A83D1